MKHIGLMALTCTSALFICYLPTVIPQEPKPQPLTLPLECEGGYCTLLKGTPQTAGMRSGLVRLKPGESIGEHTTGKNEESLVILRGQGAARIEGHPAIAFTAPALVYVPSATRHNVLNTGADLLEYVYVVAPAQAL